MDTPRNDDLQLALLAYTYYICDTWDKPLEQGDEILGRYLASSREGSAHSEPIPPDNQPTRSPEPTAENLPLVASSPGLQSGVPVTGNFESGGGFSSQIGSLSPGDKYAEYDPFWVDDASRVTVATFSSNFTFDDLFRYRILKPQDVIILQHIATYHRTEGDHHSWEDAKIRLTVLRYSRTFLINQSIPDFDVTILNCPEIRYPEMKACSRVEDIITNLDKLDVTASMIDKKFFWGHSQVFRGDQSLGSLDWVRSAFNVWRLRKEAEGDSRLTGSLT